MDYSENLNLLEDVQPERLITMGKAQEPILDQLRKRNVKIVSLGNALYPTEALASQFGLTREELADVSGKG